MMPTDATVSVAVVPIADERVEPSHLGGKGAWLRRLVQHGFPVPTTEIVTVDAYRAAATDPGVRTLLGRVQRGDVVSAEQVDEAFLAAEVADDLAAAIDRAASRVGSDGRVAVRSSASVEDTAGHSYAGQYRSFTGVEPGEVMRSVRLVWASLWHPAPCAYRRAWSVDETDIAMAVVLMKMVDAREAGVVFTRDPLGRDAARVEAVAGLGEALVSGERTPEVWYVPRDGSATEAPPAMAEAGRLALEIEQAFGEPQDVEWAHDGGRVWVVQSRPITTERGATDGADTPVDDHELTPAGIAEMLPGVLPPLIWDVNSFLVEEAFRSVLDQVVTLPAGGLGAHRFVRRVRGWAALDLDALKAVASSMPGNSSADLERQYFGEDAVAIDERDGPSRGGRMRELVHGLRSASARRRAERDAVVLTRAVSLVVDEPIDITSLDDVALLSYRARLLDLGARAMAVELATAAGAAAEYARLQGVLARHLQDGAAGAAQRVTAGAGALVALHPGASRRVFAGERWDEGSSSPLEPPAVGGRHDRHAELAELGARLRSDPRWRRTRWLSGQIVDVRWHVIRRLAEDAANGLARREQVKAAVLALGGEVRRVHLEIGRRLTEAGLLDGPGAVDQLRDHELRSALVGGTAPTPGELARRRRWLASCEIDGPLPERFTGVPPGGDVELVGQAESLRGFAASPGRYRGPARAVDTPTVDAIETGDVLVARTTDAAWSPLFVKAGAVVVERGGPLSHAAIVARELGVPAVLNVTRASRLLNGHTVVVDGDRGEVTIVESKP